MKKFLLAVSFAALCGPASAATCGAVDVDYKKVEGSHQHCPCVKKPAQVRKQERLEDRFNGGYDDSDLTPALAYRQFNNAIHTNPAAPVGASTGGSDSSQ